MDADDRFLAVFEATAEFQPGDKKYEAYRGFNLKALDRGRRVVDRLRRTYPLDGLRALDVGCGSGGLAIALAEAGAVVDAVEPDPIRLRWAQERIVGHGAAVALIAAKAERLPYPDNTFAVVTLDSVIEHVEDPALVVKQVARVLQPGGIVYVVSPNKLSLFNILRDPHYTMFGVVLLPRWLGKLYVERVRRAARGYWVNVTPTKRWIVRRFASAGVELELLEPEGFEKLSEPAVPIRNQTVRRIALAARRLGLAGSLRRVALAQYPAFILLGRKRGSR
jgi:ubiquinone/menaquinone biosynthesis C-methylase UbiE